MFSSCFRFSLKLNREFLTVSSAKCSRSILSKVLIFKGSYLTIWLTFSALGLVTEFVLLVSISCALSIATECYNLPLILTVKVHYTVGTWPEFVMA